MTYQPKFPECPYLQTKGNKCTHNKSRCKYCQYKNNTNKCERYLEWIELKESHMLAPTPIHNDSNRSLKQ